MGSRRARRGLKRFLEAVGFILAEFELKPSYMRARYCSEMLLFRFKKAPVGTLLLRNATFYVQEHAYVYARRWQTSGVQA